MDLIEPQFDSSIDDILIQFTVFLSTTVMKVGHQMATELWRFYLQLIDFWNHLNKSWKIFLVFWIFTNKIIELEKERMGHSFVWNFQIFLKSMIWTVKLG